MLYSNKGEAFRIVRSFAKALDTIETKHTDGSAEKRKASLCKFKFGADATVQKIQALYDAENYAEIIGRVRQAEKLAVEEDRLAKTGKGLLNKHVTAQATAEANVNPAKILGSVIE